MKKVKIIVLIVVGIVAVIFLLALVMPKDFQMERAIVIDAPQTMVETQVANFENFQKWSPWSELDPEMDTKIEGTDGQVGTVYSWSGNDDVGVGSMEITRREANRVDMALNFKEPWESTADTYFTWQPKDGGTEVVWGMSGKNPVPFNLFMNMDKMVGPDYEKGLAKLKDRVEK